MKQIGEGKDENGVVLTKPLTLDGSESKAPNPIQRILSLFNSIRPGADLTSLQLPATFNLPKSYLQCLGEPIYCIGNEDLLSNLNRMESPVERLAGVVAWSVSLMRPVMFSLYPYNPILGETHHVSRSNLNVLLEQVSHRPPVSALHATDQNENIEIVWCQYAVPRLHGTGVEIEAHGKRQLKLHNHNETYEMNSPKLLIRLLPLPGVDWVGTVKIKCQETGLEADICYKANSFLGRRKNYRAIAGKIYLSLTKEPLYEINGHWDRTVTLKDTSNGKSRVIYNAIEFLSTLKTPVVKDLQGVMASESAAVWSKVNRAILNQEWEKAVEAKKVIENKQRQLLKERQKKRESWVPKYFNLSSSLESGWDCSPIHRWVQPAPIFLPS